MSNMPKFFHELDGLLVPQEKILKDPKIRDHVVVQDFLHDEVDRDIAWHELEEDFHVLYGDPAPTREGDENWLWFLHNKDKTVREIAEQEELERDMGWDRPHYYDDYDYYVD